MYFIVFFLLVRGCTNTKYQLTDAYQNLPINFNWAYECHEVMSARVVKIALRCAAPQARQASTHSNESVQDMVALGTEYSNATYIIMKYVYIYIK